MCLETLANRLNSRKKSELHSQPKFSRTVALTVSHLNVDHDYFGLDANGLSFFRVPIADFVWSQTAALFLQKKIWAVSYLVISGHYHVILIILHRMFKARASRCRPPKNKRILNFDQAPHDTNTSSCPLQRMGQRFVIPVRNQKFQCRSDTFALKTVGGCREKKTVQLRQRLFTLAFFFTPTARFSASHW